MHDRAFDVGLQCEYSLYTMHTRGYVANQNLSHTTGLVSLNYAYDVVYVCMCACMCACMCVCNLNTRYKVTSKLFIIIFIGGHYERHYSYVFAQYG